jgi:hypothetical protein
VPDSAGDVLLAIGGTKLAFKGAGYHDKVSHDSLIIYR